MKLEELRRVGLHLVGYSVNGLTKDLMEPQTIVYEEELLTELIEVKEYVTTGGTIEKGTHMDTALGMSTQLEGGEFEMITTVCNDIINQLTINNN